VRRLAIRWNVLDHPGERKVHVEPVPLMGGVAIVVTLFLTIGSSLLLGPVRGFDRTLLQITRYGSIGIATMSSGLAKGAVEVPRAVSLSSRLVWWTISGPDAERKLVGRSAASITTLLGSAWSCSS
jgi:UDP-N-acetylmuramyl pentapeptide phosphotransferase/UDP-N-acetylglucosamine-1-phosphate transferase